MPTTRTPAAAVGGLAQAQLRCSRNAPGAGLEDDEIIAHALRHTFATRLVRGRTDLVIVVELLGHARLETTQAYSRPHPARRNRRARAPRRRPIERR
jgi:site-specific recombinase XerD